MKILRIFWLSLFLIPVILCLSILNFSLSPTTSAFSEFWPEKVYFSGNMSPVLVNEVNNGGIMHFDEKYYTDSGLDFSSYNTIGGTDLPNYYLAGYGVLKKGGADDYLNMLRAREYDLNYLRFFKAKIQYDLNGNPLDTSCNKNLTQDDMDNISKGIPVTNQAGTSCDGITTDDLTVPNDGLKALNALPTETNPMYIKYIPPNSDSRVFGKEKTLTF